MICEKSQKAELWCGHVCVDKVQLKESIMSEPDTIDISER
jgi:hypothetical protein